MQRQMDEIFVLPRRGVWIVYLTLRFRGEVKVNAELSKKALEKVGNPNILINLIARRVRQLNSGSGPLSRPLISNGNNLEPVDIALREIIEGKIAWELPEPVELIQPAPKKRKRR